VPLAILVAAAAVYPRLRAGLRAALAIVLGVLGIVIGAIEPAYYASSEGLSGDDYTGLVAVAGGVFLIALGATVLWRTRRRDERLIRRYARRALLTVCAVVAAYFVAFPLGLSYGLTHAARTTTPHGNLGAPYQTVAFDASDGLRLKGLLGHRADAARKGAGGDALRRPDRRSRAVRQSGPSAQLEGSLGPDHLDAGLLDLRGAWRRR